MIGALLLAVALVRPRGAVLALRSTRAGHPARGQAIHAAVPATATPADASAQLLVLPGSAPASPWATAEWLSDVFRAASRQVGVKSNTTLDLLSSFQICSAGCRNPRDFQRFGEERDGGYQLCLAATSKTKAAYSLGVGNHDKWAYHVSKRLAVPVYQFDCFRVDPRAVCKGCSFFSTCIGGANDLGRFRRAMTFSQMLSQTNHSRAGEGSLLLKMDIEGSEWTVLVDVPTQTLRKFGQLVIEFHGIHDETRHASYLTVMRHILEAGFKVAHLHGNNQDGMYEVGSFRIPAVVEVTLVLEGGRDAACMHHIEDFPGEADNSGAYGRLPPAELPPAAAPCEVRLLSGAAHGTMSELETAWCSLGRA
eukprot:CAMPEP_0168425900 /NCGR_PEP_ID=MMETSP0228-20121227/35558_1 /TAXON_ID=133427 /ORGANISM="Protoceratium reticulatum, Strain CCCM 535 (=CCMP 1889)" /LENGTH=364 /DNA_ID=CAMNT_0008439899 /DNA_START=23 /DNA_END=1115 /DNA_ORIENTATION=+